MLTSSFGSRDISVDALPRMRRRRPHNEHQKAVSSFPNVKFRPYTATKSIGDQTHLTVVKLLCVHSPAVACAYKPGPACPSACGGPMSLRHGCPDSSESLSLACGYHPGTLETSVRRLSICLAKNLKQYLNMLEQCPNKAWILKTPYRRDQTWTSSYQHTQGTKDIFPKRTRMVTWPKTSLYQHEWSPWICMKHQTPTDCLKTTKKPRNNHTNH